MDLRLFNPGSLDPKLMISNPILKHHLPDLSSLLEAKVTESVSDPFLGASLGDLGRGLDTDGKHPSSSRVQSAGGTQALCQATPSLPPLYRRSKAKREGSRGPFRGRQLRKNRQLKRKIKDFLFAGWGWG